MQARMQQLREQRRGQLEERKKELLRQQDSLTGFQISKLKEQYERELNALEAAIRREEAQQLSKMRKALLARKIAKEAKKKKEERAKAADIEKERQRQAPTPTKQVEQAATSVTFSKQSQPAAAGGRIMTKGKAEKAEAAGEDLLRILLSKWAEKVQGARAAEFENVWEQRTARAGQIEIAVEAEDTGVKEGSSQPSQNQPAETGVIGQDRKQAVEFTVEELFRRMRRIEKLTSMIRQEDERDGIPASTEQEAPSQL